MRDRMAALRSGLFDEWLAFEELEPYGFPLRNLQMAYTLASLGNFAGGKGRGKKPEPFSVEEFLLRPGGATKEPPRRLSTQATVAHVSAKFAALGVRGQPLRR